MSSSDDQLRHKLALMVLGVIVGAGSYSIAKSILSGTQRPKLKKDEKEKVQKIE